MAQNSRSVDLYAITHSKLLALMDSGRSLKRPSTEARAVEDDRTLAASLPVDYSAVDRRGHMDHHRKPIISIHGKDVDERELDHRNAA